MFFHAPEKILPWMRPTYLALSALLGFVASLGMHALVETWWLSYTEKQAITIKWTTALDQCSLPIWVQIGLPVIGISSGSLIGRIWWRWVYIDPVRGGANVTS